MNKHNARWTEADEKQMLHLHAQSKSPARNVRGHGPNL